MNFLKRLFGINPRVKKPCVHLFNRADVYACTFARLHDKNPDYPAPRCVNCGVLLDIPEIK